MEIRKQTRYEKTTYACKCVGCGTVMDVEKSDLHYCGGLKLYWTCCECESYNVESILKLKTKEVVHYVPVEVKKK